MITIQKQIFLLSDFHFNEFSEYLLKTNSVLSNKLINSIRLLDKDVTSDQLCIIVYGKCDKSTRKKFLQLTHYTFKLSCFLSRNYPNYLKHNLQLIEELISKGEKQKANFIANCLTDVASKIEDYTTLIEVNKFYAQQCYIIEDKEAYKYHKLIDNYIELEGIKNSMYVYLRENLFYKGNGNIKSNIRDTKTYYFEKYISHKSNSIRILAKFIKYFELNFTSNPIFTNTETEIGLNNLETEFLKYTYVCFHFLDDLYYKILALRLQFYVKDADALSVTKEVEKMNSVTSFLKFWNSYVNIPEIYSFSLQANYYLSFYPLFIEEKYQNKIPLEITNDLLNLKNLLKDYLLKPIWNDKNYEIKFINLKSIYAAILITGKEHEVYESINILENTLEENKRIPFQKYLDGMFVVLIMGYFIIKKYDKVCATFKRYKKLTSEYNVSKENDLTIKVYYFSAQYFGNKRNQYLKKIISTYNEAINYPHLRVQIREIVAYFRIPVVLN